MKKASAKVLRATELWLVGGLFALLVVCAIFPIVFTFGVSFMSAGEVARNYGGITLSDGYAPLHLIPERFSLSGYGKLLIETPKYLIRFWISLGVCAAISAGQVFISVLGGYAFSRFRFRFRDGIFFCLIVLMMLPYQVTLVPGYMVIKAFGLLNTNAALILPGIFSAFGTFLMRQVMATIPDSITESANLDGANYFVALWRVMVPCCLSGVAALLVLSFVDAWSMVEQPIAYIQDTYRHPLSVFLLTVNSQDMSLGFACGVLSIFLVLLLLLLFEKQLVEGISYSVLK